MIKEADQCYLLELGSGRQMADVLQDGQISQGNDLLVYEIAVEDYDALTNLFSKPTDRR